MAAKGNNNSGAQPLISLRDVQKFYPVRQRLFGPQQGKWLKAVNGVSLQLNKGQSLGIAGESGCGKSTLGRLLLKLMEMSAGEYLFNGEDVANLRSTKERLRFRKQAQLVFQNPFEALNPRFTVERSVLEPLLIHKLAPNKQKQTELVKGALKQVNLEPVEAFLHKYPHQMSGGQLQRVVLARALVLQPIFLVADEPVSMLDVSVRAGILNLMKEITKQMELTTVYISHDLSLIKYLCDYTAIMYLGQIVEYGRTEKILLEPLHPYSRALVAAIPTLQEDKRQKEIPLQNNVPSPIDLPQGCFLQDRCPYAQPRCAQERQTLRPVGKEHLVRCHLVSENSSWQEKEGGKVG